jgi:taurine dioxygenase
VQLAAVPDGEIIAMIRQALLQHLVVVIRDQPLSPAQLVRFARRFGALQRHGYIEGLQEQPEVIEIRKEPAHTQNFGGSWHADNTFLQQPPLGSVLCAVEVPARGGDTLWANQQAAYDALPRELHERIGSLWAVHSAAPAFGVMRPLAAAARCGADARHARPAEVIHPLVRTHPESGRRSLFHGGDCTLRLDGHDVGQSAALLQQILEHATAEQFVYRHRWRAGDVVFWDNRCTMHRALNDYPGERRIVRRVSIAGDTPR